MSMTTLREAAQQALEAWDTRAGIDTASRAFEAIRAALAEPATLDEAMAGPMALAQAYENGWNAAKAEPVEPVAWMDSDGFPWSKEGREMRSTPDTYTPLYTAPPQRKPLSLTDLQEALVLTNLIDRDAIEDPEEYDEGSTMAQIEALHRSIKERV